MRKTTLFILGLLCLFLTSCGTPSKPVVTLAPLPEATNSPIAMVDLATSLEADLGLTNVIVTAVDGNILEIRAAKPDVTLEKLSDGTAYIFGHVARIVTSDIGKIRVIYADGIKDKHLYEASVSDIKLWTKKQITDEEFSKKVKVVSSI